MYKIFKSVLESDKAPIVICNTEHTVIYMNDSAIKKYEKYGAAELVGKSILSCHNEKSCKMIIEITEWFGKSKSNNTVYTSRNEEENKDVYMVALRDSGGDLIGYYEKHEYRNREQAELYRCTK